MPGTRFCLEIQPRIPEALGRLQELAGDLMYTWDRRIRGLFFQLDSELWEECGHNPKVFLRRVSQARLEEAAQDRVFMEEYNRVLSSFESYHRESTRPEIRDHLSADQDLVAYFCAEFGFHESIPMYSGGLGVLAGDLVKAASDMHTPLVAVGLLYRQGYFTQTIDAHGQQEAHYTDTDFGDLPIEPVTDEQGEEIHVTVRLEHQPVAVRIWRAVLGHVNVYLLDTDLAENGEENRFITYQLYGGDSEVRIQQEIVLGIGGVRALRALGHEPTIWHINEGHAAFQVLERAREYVTEGLDFEAAMELASGATVFTTHTPVPAGHDIFGHDLIDRFFGPFLENLATDRERFLALGAVPEEGGAFNMTALGLRGSRYHNGVSRIHGGVASTMESYIWPEIPEEENPLGYVTNGVHVPTFLAREWVGYFDMHFGAQWRRELLNESFWQEGIERLPDHSFWSTRMTLKSQLFDVARGRLTHQLHRQGATQAQRARLTRYLDPDRSDILTIGFARRFATYKRATLLFTDPDRLARLVNDSDRPVVFLFAGKAHPNDEPGQHLIQVIHEFSRRPEFEGKIILLEGYDINLARKLVMGVDVWLNTPEYPKEASGTSGQKAGINGALNLSVLDGWWDEGYNKHNGWAIPAHSPDLEADYRNREEATELFELLENQVVPSYYNRDGHGYSKEWVQRSKASVKSLIPRFNAQRMLMDYVRNYYGPASRHYRRLSKNDGAPAQALADWKARIAEAWPGISLEPKACNDQIINSGESLPITVAAHLNGLSAQDVRVECLVGVTDEYGIFHTKERHGLIATGEVRADGTTLFHLDLQPSLPGLQYLKIRMYPYHTDLGHLLETGRMAWL